MSRRTDVEERIVESTSDKGEAEGRKSRALRFALAAVAAIVVACLINRIGMAWLGNVDVDAGDPDTSSFHDGCAMFLTLAIPALLGGGVAGYIARADGYYAAAAAFAIWCVLGVFWRFWNIPLVSPQSEYNRLLHFFLYNPLSALPCGAFGGWFVGQFTSGRFTLNDAEPVMAPGSDD